MSVTICSSTKTARCPGHLHLAQRPDLQQGDPAVRGHRKRGHQLQRRVDLDRGRGRAGGGNVTCPVRRERRPAQRHLHRRSAWLVRDVGLARGLVWQGNHRPKGHHALSPRSEGATGRAVSWTHLRDAAGPTIPGAKVPGTGPNTLRLARDVTKEGAWKANDWIAVATTSFSPFETEFVQLAADPTQDEDGGSQVTLKQALKYYHFGGKDPGHPSADNYNGAQSGKDYDYGVDERAEVGLISRSIKRRPCRLDESPLGGRGQDSERLHSGRLAGRRVGELRQGPSRCYRSISIGWDGQATRWSSTPTAFITATTSASRSTGART